MRTRKPGKRNYREQGEGERRRAKQEKTAIDRLSSSSGHFSLPTREQIGWMIENGYACQATIMQLQGASRMDFYRAIRALSLRERKDVGVKCASWM